MLGPAVCGGLASGRLISLFLLPELFSNAPLPLVKAGLFSCAVETVVCVLDDA